MKLEAILRNGPRQKIMITLPEKTLELLDKFTKQQQYSRSGVINEAILLWLETETNIFEGEKND